MCHCLDQSVVNHADIDEWWRHLSALVDAAGGHFEYYL